MAEITALTTLSDYTARLSTQAYNRLFAKDGGSTPDATYAALIVAEANSLFRTMTRAAFPDGVYTTGDTVDPAIVGCIVDLGCSIAASRHTSYDPEGGYAVGGARARAFIKELNRDADARPPGSSTAPAQPRAVIALTEGADGSPNNPYGRIFNGTDGGGF